ncbi:MAG TPA: DUF2339 domain-containing protein [Cyclobacteriaceae bacterium]
MEAVLLLILIVILILVVSVKNNFSSKLDSLHLKIDILRDEPRKTASTKETKPEEKSILEKIADQHKKPAEKPVEVRPKEVEEKPELVKPSPAPILPPPSLTANRPSAIIPSKPKPRRPGFFERNPDIEKFIGENLANKIGIGILVLGIGFFVKYAIDQNWINEIGRVFIGILCGGILLAIAHRLRKNFVAFSSVLIGGGIAILYLTIAIAFHEYRIFNQTSAFFLMLGITSFAVVLSLGYNRIELAVLSILGGFASPFMASAGEGNFVELFTYILILDSGMLVLAYYKKWNLVNIICYLLTVLLFGSWLGAKFDGQEISMISGALLFSTLFYLVFFAMNIVNNIKERLPFKGIEFSILLSNTFFYFGAVMFILNNETGQDYKGLFTAFLGVFNFIFAYSLFKNTRVDKNLVFLLIGLVLTFISLAAPIQLEGNYITLFWAAEAVLLLWLGQKSGLRLMKLASVVVLILMLISLLMDWGNLYINTGEFTLAILLNKAYITSIFALGSIGGTFFLLKNESQENPERVRFYKISLILAGVVLLYTSQYLELNYQLAYAQVIGYSAQVIIVGCYNMIFILGLLFAEKKWNDNQNLRDAFSFWGVLVMLVYLFYYHTHIIFSRNDYLMASGQEAGFLFHYLLIALIILIAAIGLGKIRALTEFNLKTHHAYSWFYVFFFVFLASVELDHLVLLISGAAIESQSQILAQNHKIGYPILWGLASFIIIAIGLKTKRKQLRIISLTLFLITILKLFTIDIKGISEGGKIAAFISLGILLLVVSFMYQRLKKILLDDEPVQEISKPHKLS